MNEIASFCQLDSVTFALCSGFRLVAVAGKGIGVRSVFPSCLLQSTKIRRGQLNSEVGHKNRVSRLKKVLWTKAKLTYAHSFALHLLWI